MEIEVVRPQEMSPERIARWSALQAADAAFASPFLSPYWPLAVAAAQGPAGDGLRVAVLRDAGRDAGFMAARRRGSTAMPAGAPMTDYQAMVCEPGLAFSPRALIAALGVQRLDFTHVLETQRAFAPYARGRDMSQVVDVSDGYAAYEAGRKAAGVGLLKDCDRKRRKAEREMGAVVFTADSTSRDDFDQAIRWKREQYVATGQTDVFAAGWTLALLERLFHDREPGCRAQLSTLHVDGKLAAAQVNLRGETTLHAWIIAHDAAFERYSPGLLLFQDILRWMDGEALTRLDLGPGDYRFKREMANAGIWVTHGFVGGASPAAWVRSAAYGVRQAAESLPLGRVSALPGKAMRRLDRIRALN